MTTTIDKRLARALKAVIRVGGGRGFVVEGSGYLRRMIITAAHCLPDLPLACSFSYTEERTYEKLLGPLSAEPKVSAECLFVDPVADIAVLGSPDDQGLFAEAEAYDALTEDATVPLAPAPQEGEAWLLQLDGHWSRCTVKQSDGGSLWTDNATEGIHGGMSGSPILDNQGKAVGLVVTGWRDEGGPNPSLAANLPGWLLNKLRLKPQGGREPRGRPVLLDVAGDSHD